MSIEVTEELLTCGLRRLDKLALETSDREYMAALNKCILTVNQALDLIKEAKELDAIIDKVVVTEDDNFNESACFDPFYGVRMR